GICYLLAGDTDRADLILARAVEVATDAHALPAAAIALAERSLVAIRHEDWSQAAALAEQAQGVVRTGELDGYVASALVHAVVARTDLRRGEVTRAQESGAPEGRDRTGPQHQGKLELGHTWATGERPTADNHGSLRSTFLPDELASWA
ncbi:MAG TPA: hypothetical protein VGW74_00940, partial [Propionibacteriaceae bacterium]|nr:hypothetical protein [Propionibacteriaceae bacterium]